MNIRFKTKYGLMCNDLHTHYLFEGLTKSYNILELEKTLYDLYKKDIKRIYSNESEYDSNEFPEKIRIIVDKRISLNTFKDIIDTCFNLYGWIFTKAIPILTDLKRNSKIKYDYDFICLNTKNFDILKKSEWTDFIELEFEAKFSKEILSFPKNTILYHASVSNHLDKIIKFGFVPKTSNKFIDKNIKENPISRIYFSTNPSESIDIIYDTLTGKNKQDELILFRISSKNLLTIFDGFNKDSVHFFEDVRSLHGVFTYNNIHPKYIDLYIGNIFDKDEIYEDKNWVNLLELK